MFQWHHSEHRPTHQSGACICILKYAHNCLLFEFTVGKALVVLYTVNNGISTILLDDLHDVDRESLAWHFPLFSLLAIHSLQRCDRSPNHDALDHCQAPDTVPMLTAVLSGSVRCPLKGRQGSQSNCLTGPWNKGSTTQGGQRKAFPNLEIEFGVTNTAGKRQHWMTPGHLTAEKGTLLQSNCPVLQD